MHPLLRPSHRFRQNDDDRVLPLVNVVFLLLIFFMIAGHMTVQDPFDVVPPASVSETEGNLREAVLFVSADGEVALDGEPMDDALLGDALKDMRESAGEIDLRLKADGEAEAQAVIRIMAIVRDAGVEKLRLITLKDAR